MYYVVSKTGQPSILANQRRELCMPHYAIGNNAKNPPYGLEGAVKYTKLGMMRCPRIIKGSTQTDLIGPFINELMLYFHLLRFPLFKRLFHFVASQIYGGRLNELADATIFSKSEMKSKSTTWPHPDFQVLCLGDWQQSMSYVSPPISVKEYQDALMAWDGIYKESDLSYLARPVPLFLNIMRLVLKVARRNVKCLDSVGGIDNDNVVYALDGVWSSECLQLREWGNLATNNWRCYQTVMSLPCTEHRTRANGGEMDEQGIEANMSEGYRQLAYWDVDGLSLVAYPVRVYINSAGSYDVMCTTAGVLGPHKNDGPNDLKRRRFRAMWSANFIDPDALGYFANFNQNVGYRKMFEADSIRMTSEHVITAVLQCLDFGQTCADENIDEYGHFKALYISNNLTSEEMANLRGTLNEARNFWKLANSGVSSAGVLGEAGRVLSKLPKTAYAASTRYTHTPFKLPLSLIQRMAASGSSICKAFVAGGDFSVHNGTLLGEYYSRETALEFVLKTFSSKMFIFLSNRLDEVLKRAADARTEMDRLTAYLRERELDLPTEVPRNSVKMFWNRIRYAFQSNRRLMFTASEIRSYWNLNFETILEDSDFLMQEMGIAAYSTSELVNDEPELLHKGSIDDYYVKTIVPSGKTRKEFTSQIRKYRALIPISTREIGILADWREKILSGEDSEVKAGPGLTEYLRGFIDAIDPKFLESRSNEYTE